MSLHHFVHPEWLPLIATVWLAAAVAMTWARRRAALRARRLLGPRGPRPAWRADAALLLSLGLVGGALLGPRGGERSALVPSRGVDVVLLVDVSRSMDARDVAPSRLVRAQTAGAAILAGLGPEDRAALAIFAGRGVLLTPLTPDREALAALLADLSTDLVRPRGSDLGDGVRHATEAFEPASERPRAILVLSDGEDPSGRSATGASEALRAEARVHAVALGREAGAPIPDHGVALRDPKGAVVVTRRNAERLERLATATGGELFVADAWGAIDVDAALEAVRAEVGAGPGGLARRRVRAVRVAPIAALAFALLALEAAIPRRRALRRSTLAIGIGAAGLLLGAAPPDPDGVEQLEAALEAKPRDPELLVRLGLARLERGRATEAARAFNAAALASNEPELTALAYFDLGVAQLEAGALEAARDAFFDALAIDADDREARFNLEWTLRALASRPLNPPPDPEPRRREPEPRQHQRAPGDANQEPARPLAGGSGGLAPEELERWLDRVDDDLGRALRSAAREAGASRAEAGLGW